MQIVQSLQQLPRSVFDDSPSAVGRQSEGRNDDQAAGVEPVPTDVAQLQKRVDSLELTFRVLLKRLGAMDRVVERDDQKQQQHQQKRPQHQQKQQKRVPDIQKPLNSTMTMRSATANRNCSVDELMCLLRQAMRDECMAQAAAGRQSESRNDDYTTEIESETDTCGSDTDEMPTFDFNEFDN